MVKGHVGFEGVRAILLILIASQVCPSLCKEGLFKMSRSVNNEVAGRSETAHGIQRCALQVCVEDTEISFQDWVLFIIANTVVATVASTNMFCI